MTDPHPTVPEITPKALKARLDAGERLVLLDVREPYEREMAEIEVPDGSTGLFVPIRQISAEIRAFESALRAAPVVVYCHHGVRSASVAQWLISHGFSRVENLKGGIDAWSVQADRSVPRY